MSPAEHQHRPSPAPSVLVLGGTTEGRELAEALTADGWEVLTSLAGRTAEPARPPGQVRTGGFGGAAGLREWLATHRPACVVDATHPFATGISANAAPACADVGVPLLALRRPSWAQTHPGAAGWIWAADHEEAARLARAVGSTVEGAILLTVGRQATRRYLPALRDHRVVARVAEARDLQVPPGWRLLQTRGPFSPASERELFAREHIRVVVSKDSGGAATAAKLDVASELGVAVIMVRRPQPLPSLDAEVCEAGAKVSEAGARVSEAGTGVCEVNDVVCEAGTKVSEVGAKVSEVGAKVSEVGAKVSEVGAVEDALRWCRRVLGGGGDSGSGPTTAT